MRKRDWALIISALLAVWAFDILTKQWALLTQGPLVFHGPMGLLVHRNPGAMLGMFSDLPPLLRVVTLSTGGAFLLFMYAAIQYLLPHKLLLLRVGMSLLVGGILGNVTDRIVWGSVVDWILFGSLEWMTPAFNFADVIQWVGYGLIVVTMVRKGHLLWPSREDRKSIWVNPTYQLRYSLLLVGIGFLFSLVVGVFTYTFIQVLIDTVAPGPSRFLENRFLIPFVITFSMLAAGFMVTLFLIGRVLSHRTAGPIYAFERFVDDLLQGRDRQLRLRAGDEFKHLEELGHKLRIYLQRQKQESDPILPRGREDFKRTGS
jgi:signal peptidase II